MRLFVVPITSIIAALSLFSVGALAATTTDTSSTSSSDASEVPTACQTTAAQAATPSTTGTSVTGTATTIATATPTVVTTATTTANDDEVPDRAEDNTGQAIRTCIAALHEGGEHGIGQAVSELAHELNAERQAADEADHGRNSKDDVPPAVSATPTAISTLATSTPSTTAIVAPSTATPQSKGQNPTTEHGHRRGGEHGRD